MEAMPQIAVEGGTRRLRHEQSFADLLFGAGSKRRSALRYFENVRRGGVNL